MSPNDVKKDEAEPVETDDIQTEGEETQDEEEEAGEDFEENDAPAEMTGPSKPRE